MCVIVHFTRMIFGQFLHVQNALHAYIPGHGTRFLGGSPIFPLSYLRSHEDVCIGELISTHWGSPTFSEAEISQSDMSTGVCVSKMLIFGGGEVQLSLPTAQRCLLDKSVLILLL